MKKLFLLLTVLLLAFAGGAFAYTIDCGNDDPGMDDDDDPCPPGVNPIDAQKANVHREVTDLQTYGNAPVDFKRIYNSRTTDFNSPYWELGANQTWQHNWNFEMRDLTSTTNGFHNVKIRFPDGRDYNFKSVDTNGVQRAPSPDLGDRLYKWTGSTTGHTMVTPDGWEYDFQRTTYPKYKVTEVRNGQGLSWNLTYDSSNRLTRVENGFGRSIQIDRETGSDGIDRIKSVTSSDGRQINYSYSDWNGTGTPKSTLSDASYPGGEHADYNYKGGDSPTSGRPVLSDATDPAYRGERTSREHHGPSYDNPGAGSRPRGGNDSSQRGRAPGAGGDSPQRGRAPGKRGDGGSRGRPQGDSAGAQAKYDYNYDAIYDLGNGPFLVTGTVKEERNKANDELIVEMPLGSGTEPQIRQGDGTEIGRKYDKGHLVEKADGEGRKTSLSRDSGGYGFIASLTDNAGNATTWERDYAGRILRESDAHSNSITNTYNSAGFLASTADKMGRVTTFTRDISNRPVRIDRPDASYETFNYNTYGLPTSHRLPNAGTETFAYYDGQELGGKLGDLKSHTDPAGNTRTYTHDERGLVSSVTNPKGNTTTYSHDWRGQLLTVTKPDNITSTLRYDTFGNLTNAVDELGHGTVFEYDEYNRLKTFQDPLGRVTTFEHGRSPSSGCNCGYLDTISKVVDPAGDAVEFTYDRSGKYLSETVIPQVGQTNTTTYAYDEVGNLNSQTDALNHTYTWVFDTLRRPVAETNQMGEASSYTFNAGGELVGRIDGAGVNSAWSYDNLHRVTTASSGTLTYSYGYDEGGRRTNISAEISGTAVDRTYYTYDARNLVLTKTLPTGYSVTYSYDALHNRTNVVAKRDITTGDILNISYTYDNLNRLKTIAANGKTTTYSYDAAGRRIGVEWPNGTTTSYSYDAANQLLSIIHRQSDSSLITSNAYEYDSKGNPLRMTNSEGVTTYGYNFRNWLISAAYPDGRTQLFSYDSVGNRTSLVETVGASLTNANLSYHYDDANRLTSAVSSTDTNAYSYDGDGRLTNQIVNGQSRSYTYTFRSQVTSLTDTNGTTFTYEYDGDGNRLRASMGGCLTSQYIYDGANILLELNGSNDVVRAYVNGPAMDERIERIDFLASERGRYVYHGDALGSIMAITDASQNVVKTYAYEAFGKVRAEGSGNFIDRYGFTGREAIGDSLGFYWYRARMFDPSTGRFISRDPIGFLSGDMTLYLYAANNPTRWVDPVGFDTVSISYPVLSLPVKTGSIVEVGVEGTVTISDDPGTPFLDGKFEPELALGKWGPSASYDGSGVDVSWFDCEFEPGKGASVTTPIISGSWKVNPKTNSATFFLKMLGAIGIKTPPALESGLKEIGVIP